jgi:hypothetical protein
MNIIFGDNVAEQAQEKYTVLELDTFVIEKENTTDATATAYALIENIPLQEMPTVENFKELHSNLMKEYRKQNWKYCEDAIDHLQGHWNGELDTFYSELSERLKTLKTQSLPSDWTGTILRSA